MQYIRESKEHYNRAMLGETYSGKKRKADRKGVLPVLSAQVDLQSIFSSNDLGYKEIRLDKIIGTYNESRGQSFASDFIPKSNVKSEFAYKWINLCSAQLKEGIRDPLLVYEYLNHYYVQEGNKRVSVLKYFEAVEVRAKVLRLVPPYDENNEEIKIYYAYLDFTDKTDYEDIWFSKFCRFEQLIEFMDNNKGDSTYKEYLSYYYSTFRKIYKNFIEYKYSDASMLTTGDVFLSYCKMFSAEEISEALLIKRIGEVIKQCNSDTLIEVDDSVSVGFMERSVLQLFRKPKVAFIFPYSSQINGWAKDHWRSQKAMEKLYEGQMTVDLVEDVLNDEDPIGVLRQAAEDYEVLFLIDCVIESIALQCSADFPQTTFLLCSGIKSTYLLPSYYGKTYQTNFLLGLYAGMITDKDKVGYVSCDMNHQIYRSIRAFEDGFRSIRPKVKMQFVNNEESLDDDIVYSAFYRSVVGSHLTEGTVNTFFKKRKTNDYLAYTYWNWEKFYEDMLARIIDGSFNKIRNINNQANNRMFFHWGMGTDVIDIMVNGSMPTKSSEMIFDNIRSSIVDGSFDLSYLTDLSGYEDWCQLYKEGGWT